METLFIYKPLAFIMWLLLYIHIFIPFFAVAMVVLFDSHSKSCGSSLSKISDITNESTDDIGANPIFCVFTGRSVMALHASFGNLWRGSIPTPCAIQVCPPMCFGLGGLSYLSSTVFRA